MEPLAKSCGLFRKDRARKQANRDHGHLAWIDTDKPPAACRFHTMPAKIFIDGEAGTTELGIHVRLQADRGIELLSLPPGQRKDKGAKKALMEDADIVVLCLPDDAAREAVAIASTLGERSPRILDASTAHRVAKGWIDGFPELAPGQAEAIKNAKFVANPGCYATGAIALLRPLVDAGLLPSRLSGLNPCGVGIFGRRQGDDCRL
jgi:N-acetyl-gamma-glutamyl-phosphate reductase uncommon form